jgi:hypothetical protein
MLIGDRANLDDALAFAYDDHTCAIYPACQPPRRPSRPPAGPTNEPFLRLPLIDAPKTSNVGAYPVR